MGTDWTGKTHVFLTEYSFFIGMLLQLQKSIAKGKSAKKKEAVVILLWTL